MTGGWRDRARARLKAPRRLRFYRAGWVVTVASIMLGLAAMATGNNLLFLLLGAMLGLIALSGWMSELTLRGVSVRRIVPRQMVAGERGTIRYVVENTNRRVPIFAISIVERDLLAADMGDTAVRGAFVPTVPRRATSEARVAVGWRRRGIYRLNTITISTSFPFGLFEKSRDVEIADDVVVLPRSDLRLRPARPFGKDDHAMGDVATGAAGVRGEFAGLRSYRMGDDPRDIHWRSTARAGEPIMREYAPERSLGVWVCLDTRPMGDAAMMERAVECAATLVVRGLRDGRPVGLAAGDAIIPPGTGTQQIDRTLRLLAGVRFHAGSPTPALPSDPARCVLVASGLSTGSWGDVFTAEDFG